MVADPARYETMALPALLRQARRPYARATVTALAQAGFDDVPRNGSYVLAASARDGAQLSHIIKELGVSKQAAGQLIDTLVSRGYLDRSVDPQDRRRLTIALTERGAAAAAVITVAVAAVDTRLAGNVSAEHIAHARAVLGALTDLGAEPGPPAQP
jgi:DNA-binding MarR family transcriptional regulator